MQGGIKLPLWNTLLPIQLCTLTVSTVQVCKLTTCMYSYAHMLTTHTAMYIDNMYSYVRMLTTHM